jgi:hypothetical protein
MTLSATAQAPAIIASEREEGKWNECHVYGVTKESVAILSPNTIDTVIKYRHNTNTQFIRTRS